jgi:restriction endonuclease S subunit
VSFPIAKLGEVCSFVRGLTYSKSDEVEFSSNIVVRATNIDLSTHKLDLSELRYISDLIQVRDEKRLKKNDILICTASGSKSHLGKVALVESDLGMSFGGFMGALRVNSQKITPQYLFTFLVSSEFKRHIEGLSDGANINNLKFSQIEQFGLPLPPLSTQQKIVTKLDAIFAEIDKAKASAEANARNAEALFQSRLSDIFHSGNSNFISKPIREIGEIFSGTGFPVEQQGLLNEEIPFYKVSDMNRAGNERHMISHNNSISRGTAKRLGAKIIPAKSVIFPKIGGAIATNKKRILSVPSCVDNNVMGICPDDKLVSPRFFFHLINSIELSSFANDAALPSIKKSTVEERLVKIPKSLSEQESICNLIESLEENSTKLRNSYFVKLNDLSLLKHSILRQAFTGDLVKE